MKIAYFDCFAGASGDMILGSLLDAGLDFEKLKSELAKLKLKEYDLQIKKSVKKGISGTKFDVQVHHHGQNHEHDKKPENSHHSHRTLKDINALIEKSGLPDHIKVTSKLIFLRLAEAEGKIHNKKPKDIHFHEVGAVDSIIDIVGAVIGLDLMGIEEVRASRIHVGTGTLECSHGTLPVPAPATLELLKNIPIRSSDIDGELVTPTGAAILGTLSVNFGAMPPMIIEKTGYGIGSRDLPIANVLRLVIGESHSESEEDQVQLIETNIDDMNPQFYEHIMEVLFSKGAKDVFLTPIIMKKNRPGVILSVLATPELIEKMIDIIFRETTTLGVRISEIQKRTILKREIKTIQTRWGEARVKIRTTGRKKSASPEYDDCKRIAQDRNIPIQTVYEEIRRTAEKSFRSGAGASE